MERARNYAEEDANRKIDRIEQSAASSRPDLLGGVYNPRIPTVTGSQIGSYNETELGQKCATIFASYQARAEGIPIGNSKRQSAINQIKVNNLLIEGLNKCMSSVPADSRTFKEAHAQALVYKADSDQINRQVLSTTTNSSRSCGGPAIDGPGC